MNKYLCFSSKSRQSVAATCLLATELKGVRVRHSTNCIVLHAGPVLSTHLLLKGPHMKAKSKWAGLTFLSPGLATSCLTLAFRPATVSKCGMEEQATQLNPSALRAAILKRKPRCSLDADARLRLCLCIRRGSLSPSQMNEWINDDPTVNSLS